MKKKAICVFKGESKEEFDIMFNKIQSYKRTIEHLSIKVFESEKLLWERIKNISPQLKNSIFGKEVFNFKYDYETGKIFKIER